MALRSSSKSFPARSSIILMSASVENLLLMENRHRRLDQRMGADAFSQGKGQSFGRQPLFAVCHPVRVAPG